MADKGDLWCFVGDPFNGFTIYNGNRPLIFKNCSSDTSQGNYGKKGNTAYYDGKGGTVTYAQLGTTEETQLWDISDVKRGNASVGVDGAFFICDHGTYNDGRHCLGINSGKVSFNNFNYRNKSLTANNAFTYSTDIAWTLKDGGDGSYYSTLYLPFEAATPEGVTAYTGKINDEKTSVKMTAIEGGIIPAETGVLLVGNAESATLTLSSTSATAITDNSLTGTCSDLTGQTQANFLVFGKSSTTLGFYKPNSTTLLANRAYIDNSTQGIKGLALSFGGETTGISAAETATPAANAAPVYDLAGRRIAKPAKGFYIQGGKKFLAQ